MFNVSIARLMLIVGMIAVFLASAIAGAFVFAVVTLVTSTIAACWFRGARRAFFGGFSATGWACLLVVFGGGPRGRIMLPTTRPIVWVYDAIYGSASPAFKTQEEAEVWIRDLTVSVHKALVFGNALIALVLALLGGVMTWLIFMIWHHKLRTSGPTAG